MGPDFKTCKYAEPGWDFCILKFNQKSVRKTVLGQMEITLIQSDAVDCFDFAKIEGIHSQYSILYLLEVC